MLQAQQNTNPMCLRTNLLVIIFCQISTKLNKHIYAAAAAAAAVVVVVVVASMQHKDTLE
jgi:hypothetical protein